MTQGTVAAGTEPAARAGATILAAGGNAADAASATILAQCVADPANVSLFGRCHILLRHPDGQVRAFDGTTRCPDGTPPLADGQMERDGFTAAPLPGLPHAVEHMQREYGTLPFARVVAPAIALARDGAAVGASLSEVWREHAATLARNPAAAAVYGTPGPAVHHPALAGLLRRYAEQGAAGIVAGDVGKALAGAIHAAGGFWTAEDLAQDACREGEVISIPFREWRVSMIGRQGWGHTLAQMLRLLDLMPPFGRTMTADEAARLVLVILASFEDRPQHLGSLTPKPDALPYDRLIDPAFARDRLRGIEDLLADQTALAARLNDTLHGDEPLADQDTSHLSVIDGQGLAVSLTASIGPHFGARVADPLHGVLLAASYRMRHAPEAGARDVTEMSPAIATHPDGRVLAIGAAGSERIPGAIAQVLVNHIDRGLPLDDAVAFPRLNIKEGRLLIHESMPAEVIGALRRRGVPCTVADSPVTRHKGIVQAVLRRPDGSLAGVSDPAYDGATVQAR